MRIRVKVIPKAKKSGIEPLPDGGLRVRVVAPAEGGRANTAVIEALAEHFGVPRRSVTILQGATHRTKLVEIIRSHEGNPVRTH
ncbi:MAG: DUF167 domain-containing protein [Candidatus Omnitrophota bacterium]|nr:DUF167 domain-containing protein [Candidatus Omnitrophota bacterium]